MENSNWNIKKRLQHLLNILLIIVFVLSNTDINGQEKVNFTRDNKKFTKKEISQFKSSKSYEDYVGSFNGVNSYSNGSTSNVSNNYNYSTGINTGMKWQCVEYVNRYYYVIYNQNIRVAGHNANDYFNNATQHGLDAHLNNGTAKPQVGDLLCSNGGGYGHVAIVREVGSNYINVIHQNWSNSSSDNSKTISLNGNIVSAFGTNYPVIGWLRSPNSKPSSPVPLTPTANTSDVNIPIFHNWTSSNGNPEYRIQVSRANTYWTAEDGFTSNTNPTAMVVVNKNTGSTSSYEWSSNSSGTYENPRETTEYWWTVKVFVNGKSSDYSTPIKYTTGSSSSGNPDLSYYAQDILDDINGQGVGDGDGKAEPGEEIDLKVRLRNTGNETATNVRATLSTTDSDINIVDNSENFPDISSGSSEWCDVDFDFDISSSCQSKDVTFLLNITSDQGSWTDQFTMHVYGGSTSPNLEYYAQDIFDDIDGQGVGDGDGKAEPGEEIDLKVRLRNSGNATANNVRAILSTTDSDISFSDQSENYGNISAGSNIWCGADYDFDISLNCPEKDITFKLEISSDEGNWTEYFTIHVYASSLPDLTVDYSNASPSTIQAGSTTNLSCRIRNIGLGASTNSNRVGYYLSTNNTYGSSDIFLGYDSFNALAANGAYSNETEIITIPANTSAGIYYILYFADYSNFLTESNENNNLAYKQITVTVPKPDYIIQSQNVNNIILNPGSSFNVSCTVKNNGASSSGETYMGYYLSNNTTFGNDTYLGDDHVVALGAGATSNENATFTIPENTAPGNYYILFIADWLSSENESNENNNVSYIQITVQSNTYGISLYAYPSNGGSFSGAGNYTQGQSCNLSAIASTGYTFKNWTENGQVVSINANYSFTVTSNRNLVVNFEAKTFNITTSVYSNTGGIVIGNGVYNYGQSCNLSAIASTGYTFKNWTENGQIVSTNANYGFTVTRNRNLVANFEAKIFNITASANPSNGCTVGGTGTYDYGQAANMTATPATNYIFINWTENGTEVSTDANYSFTVTKNRTLVANFELQAFNISVSANPSNQGTVSGEGNYNYGQSCNLSAIAATGYTFKNWTENGQIVSTNANYSFTVTSNRNLVANFTQNTYSVTFIVKNETVPMPNTEVNLTGYGTKMTNYDGVTIFYNVVPENDIEYIITNNNNNETGFISVIDSDVNKTIILSTTGIDDVKKVKFNIYPNPAMYFLNIKHNASLIKSIMQVVDLHGKIIEQKSINSHKLSLDVRNYKKGIYILIIKGVGFKNQSKFTVQ